MLWALRGHLDLALRPHLWWRVATASLVVNILVIAAGLGGLWWYWPWRADDSLALDQLGRWYLVLSATTVVCVPLLKGRAGPAALRPFFAGLGREVGDRGRGFVGGLGHLVRTLPWRLLWVLAAAGATVLAHPLAGAVVALWGVGHLTVLDALDQALVMAIPDAADRVAPRRALRTEAFAAGAIAGLLFLVASTTVFGVLLWVPAIFLGAGRRVHRALGQAGPPPPTHGLSV